MDLLNKEEVNELERCEVVIRQGLQTFIEVGQALLTIRDKRLYRSEFKTFEEYCNERWGMRKTWLYQMIGSAEVISNLSANADILPSTESQARPLTKLEPEVQIEAWSEVVAQHGQDITAPKVQAIADQFLEVNGQIKQAKKEPLFTADSPEELLRKAKEVKRAMNEKKLENLTEAIKIKQSYQFNNDYDAPIIYNESAVEFLKKIESNSIDLLITDPPYLSEFNCHESFLDFIRSWVFDALSKVKDTGRAFICSGAYPKEIHAYLNVFSSVPDIIVDNPLVWTYRNTLGVTPKKKYNLNYQLIWHLYTENSFDLDTSITNEMFSVQDINAPDGRIGNRFHAWQKPDELADRLIRHTTKEGDKIIDCFAGTGTFLISAAKHNRKAMGCDASKGQIQTAKIRGCKIG